MVDSDPYPKSSDRNSIRTAVPVLLAMVIWLALFVSGCGGGLPPVEATPPVSKTQANTTTGTSPPEAPAATSGGTTAASQPGEQTVEPTIPPQPTAADFPGLAWSYPLGSPINFNFTIGADGAIYTLGNSEVANVVDPDSVNGATLEAIRMRESDVVTVVNPDGSLRGSFTLPKTPYIIPETDTSAERPILPVGLPDGTILVVSGENTVYAAGPNGLLLWEQPLEASPYSDPAAQGGVFYLLDVAARLYAFDANGPLWSLQSQAADNTAGDLALSPEGTAYYVATNFSQGYLQAVSPAGQDLWATGVETELFYNQPKVSPAGDLVSLREDLFDAQTGELQHYETTVKIDEYVFGLDGNLYARSGGSVVQLDIQGDRLEAVRQANPSGASGALTFPRSLVVDQNSVIWLTYGDFPERELTWYSNEGDLLGSRTLSFIQGSASDPDYASSRVLLCQSDENFEATLCGLYSPLASNPVWEERFNNLPGFSNSQTREGFTYFITWDGILYKVNLRAP